MVLWIGTSPSLHRDMLGIFAWMVREIFILREVLLSPVWQMMEPLSGEREKAHLYLAYGTQVLGMGSFITLMV